MVTCDHKDERRELGLLPILSHFVTVLEFLFVFNILRKTEHKWVARCDLLFGKCTFTVSFIRYFTEFESYQEN